MTENQSHGNNAAVKKPRRLNGIVIIGLILASIIAINYRPEVTSVHCNKEILSTKPDVIMLGAWWCAYCYQARRYFENNNIRYCEYDIEQSYEGKRIYENINGQSVPIFLIGKYRINGFDENMVEHLLSEMNTQ